MESRIIDCFTKIKNKEKFYLLEVNMARDIIYLTLHQKEGKETILNISLDRKEVFEKYFFMKKGLYVENYREYVNDNRYKTKKITKVDKAIELKYIDLIF